MKLNELAEGRITKDPTSKDPYIRALRTITPAAEKNPREAYLKQLAQDYDVPLSKVKALADQMGPEEDFDGLVLHVNELSDPGK